MAVCNPFKLDLVLIKVSPNSFSQPVKKVPWRSTKGSLNTTPGHGAVASRTWSGMYVLGSSHSSADIVAAFHRP
eukprot:scaffold170793_cov18-Tisochrysis_lutea.AAC.1